MSKLTNLFAKDCTYNDANKTAYLKEGMRVLRQLAKELNLPRDSYSVRKNEGGIAVPGDVTLHADTFYLTTAAWGSDLKMLLRTCTGQKDYTGGPNNYVSPDLLYEPAAFARQLSRMRIDLPGAQATAEAPEEAGMGM